MAFVFNPITQKLDIVSNKKDCDDTSVTVRRRLTVLSGGSLEVDTGGSVKIKKFSGLSRAIVTGHVTVLSDGHLEIDHNSSLKVEAA